MKIFLASCVRQDNARQSERVNHIKSHLKTAGHRLYEYVYDQNNLNDQRGFSDLSEQILDSDVYIAEMSLPSQTLGFQMAFALNSTKPCFYLYWKDTRGKPDAPLSDHPSRLLKITAYGEDDLGSKLANFLGYAKKQLATKRTSFMSTQEIDRYLSEESQRLGVHKAEIIRQILSEASERRK